MTKTDWLKYFFNRMGEKGVRNFDISETGELPPDSVPRTTAREIMPSDKIVYQKELSIQIAKGHKYALMWFDHVLCGDAGNLEKGVEEGYNIGLELGARRNFSFCYDLLGDTAFTMGIHSIKNIDSSRIIDDDFNGTPMRQFYNAQKIEDTKEVIDKLSEVVVQLYKQARYR